VTSSNEILEDVPTTNLELLSVEYHLGRAYLMLPQTTPDSNDSHISGRQPQSAIDRRRNVKIAIEYYFAFLKGLERLGEHMLENETLVEYHRLLDNDDVDDDIDNDDNVDGHINNNQLPRRSMNNRSRSNNPALMREMKIRHYQRKKAIEQRKQQYQSQLQRRLRLKLSDDEILDGYDSENLVRAYHIETLRHYAENSLEEISSSMLELEMLQLSIRMSNSSSYSNDGNGNDSRMAKQQQTVTTTSTTQQQQQPQQQPLQMTQIVKNPLNGELVLLPKHSVGGQLLTTNTNTTSIIKRTDIANTIFRPSWNLPTMTLQQLGDMEYADAIQRAEQQRHVESQAMYQPRRYDQLVRDGMEDDTYLVEQSAKLDRDWDDWKDENPKGCGNKMSERGDRNF
jgi:immunoglobulin-binding protein 1